MIDYPIHQRNARHVHHPVHDVGGGVGVGHPRNRITNPSQNSVQMSRE